MAGVTFIDTDLMYGIVEELNMLRKAVVVERERKYDFAEKLQITRGYSAELLEKIKSMRKEVDMGELSSVLAVPEKLSGEVWEKLDRISSLLDTLESRSKLVSDKVRPVTVSVPQAEETGKKEEPYSTQIGEILVILGNRIMVVNDRLDYLLKYVQV